MLIREFNFARDYDVVLDLWQSAGPGVHVGLSDTAEEIAQKLTRDPDLFLVAEHDGKIAGAVLGGFDGRRGMVYHLAVAADRRGRGLGTALMTELESRLKAKGCLKYYLLVAEGNVEALDFYLRRGWEVMPVHILGKTIQ